VDVDIKGFFDNIPHDLIMESIYARISDGNILKLIKKFLNSGVMEEGIFTPKIKGTPQGGVISPVLLNVALHGMEQAAGVRYRTSQECRANRSTSFVGQSA